MNSKMLKYMTLVLFAISFERSLCQESLDSRRSLNPLKQEYFFTEIARNFPQSFSLSVFKAGGYHPILGYRYNLLGNWMMGLGIQFKNFERKKRELIQSEEGTKGLSRNLAIWTIYHEGLYLIRLDHPTYLLLGPKILYLLPSKAASLPLVKDDSYSVEIGGAFSGSLLRVLENKSFISLRIDRWRGTKSNRLHGLEISAGFGYPF
jgi:hypothetical protein